MKKKKLSLKEEQLIWYKKLKKSGFEDIEWSGNVDSRYLKYSPAPKSMAELNEKRTYYRLATAYLSSHQSLRGRNRFIWKMHARGATYGEIEIAYNTKYNPGINTYDLYYLVQKLYDKCVQWNTLSPNGLLYEGNDG